MSTSRARLDPQRPTPQMLRWAYANAIFPMADPFSGQIEWFSPDPRGIIPLDAFHVPKNLARDVRKMRFDIRADTAFKQVMRACATPRSCENLSWIDQRLIDAYVQLHQEGNAHSIEAWLDDRLVGGLYGVHLGGAFFGESMFTRPDIGGTNASKVCLVHLVHWLRARCFTLLDTQFWNEHLDQFGCIEISRDAYFERLERALQSPATWGEFQPLGA